jgi:hypothetical protein
MRVVEGGNSSGFLTSSHESRRGSMVDLFDTSSVDPFATPFLGMNTETRERMLVDATGSATGSRTLSHTKRRLAVTSMKRRYVKRFCRYRGTGICPPLRLAFSSTKTRNSDAKRSIHGRRYDRLHGHFSHPAERQRRAGYRRPVARLAAAALGFTSLLLACKHQLTFALPVWYF